jgi:DNA-binding NarL/FixJ family response regulator
MEIRIVLGDEADVVLIGVQTILKDRVEWKVVHTVRSGDALLEAARRLQPEVILFNERLVLQPQIMVQ